MVYVAISSVSETTAFLVAHYGKSFLDFLGGFWLEPFPLEIHSFCIWPFLKNLWQITFDLVDYPNSETLTFPLLWILKSTCLKALLTDCPMATIYALGSEGWYWDFSLPLAGSRCFELTRSQYSCVASCTRESYVMSSSGDMTFMPHTRSLFINSLTSL